MEDLPKYVRFELPNGTSTLSLHYADLGPRMAGAGIVLYLECEDLDGRVKELKAAGVVFDTDPVDQPWLWREAGLRDPDGNELRLYSAGTNRKNPPWRLAVPPK
ncbi:MAG TPA: VOC family protein [Polyangiaceae bacterium]